MAAPIDLTPYRLTAARNLGINIEFRRMQGREFSGTRTDYALLTQDQQLRLAPEIARLVQLRPNLDPAQQTAAAKLAAPPPPPGPTTLQLIASGAVEGLVAIPRHVGGAVEQATGGTVSNLLTKVTVIAALAVGGMLLVQSGAFRGTFKRRN